jgi:putative peptidoglycan lipid II flippase
MPNFFARGDTVTPVKYSAVVFVANFTMNLLLMKPFGHVGIAMATTVAAFVSLYQYIHGLKKRDYWQISKELKQTILKIALCSAITGLMLIIVELCLNTVFPPKHLGYLFLKLSVIGIIGLATFLISAKMCHALDITAVIKSLLARRKRA